MFVANSIAEFKQSFCDGLAGMLAPDALGAYILVLANSLQSQDLRTRLIAALQSNFIELKGSFDAGTLRATPDDIDVFQKLITVDPGTLALSRYIRAGDWLLVENALRALRPARAARHVITDLQQGFDAEKFNFNKPFLRPEILWQDSWQGHDLRVLYNKFPLARHHLLVVPDAEQGLPQYLTRHYHEMAVELVQYSQQCLPGLYIGYNSLGAFASVNHLHFHVVIRERGFPVEAAHWTHRGGNRDYPLTIRLFDSAAKSWKLIERLHEAGQTYNILYTHYGVYLLARKAQNTIALPECLQSAGWAELSGEVTLSCAPAANSKVTADIIRGLRTLSVQ